MTLTNKELRALNLVRIIHEREESLEKLTEQLALFRTMLRAVMSEPDDAVQS
jgi:hypothetical protein